MTYTVNYAKIAPTKLSTIIYNTTGLINYWEREDNKTYKITVLCGEDARKMVTDLIEQFI